MIKLVEDKWRMLTHAAEMTVPGRSFQCPMGRSDGTVHVQIDPLGRFAVMNLVDQCPDKPASTERLSAAAKPRSRTASSGLRRRRWHPRTVHQRPAASPDRALGGPRHSRLHIRPTVRRPADATDQPSSADGCAECAHFSTLRQQYRAGRGLHPVLRTTGDHRQDLS